MNSRSSSSKTWWDICIGILERASKGELKLSSRRPWEARRNQGLDQVVSKRIGRGGGMYRPENLGIGQEGMILTKYIFAVGLAIVTRCSYFETLEA